MVRKCSEPELCALTRGSGNWEKTRAVAERALTFQVLDAIWPWLSRTTQDGKTHVGPDAMVPRVQGGSLKQSKVPGSPCLPGAPAEKRGEGAGGGLGVHLLQFSQARPPGEDK